mgnify:CR=1 FL=1
MSKHKKDFFRSIAHLVVLGFIDVEEEIVSVTERDEELVRRTYRLTPKGKDLAETLLKNIPEDVKETIQTLKKFNEMTLQQLHDYCRVKYGKC